MVTVVVAVGLAAGVIWYGGQPPEVTAALSLITWWAVAGTVAFGLLPASRIGHRGLLALSLLFGLTAFTALSFTWTNNEGLAFEAIVQMICMLGIFLLALLISREGEALSWIRGIAIGLGVIVLMAALSRFFPAIGNDTELAKELYGSSGRLSWPLGYWNATGAVTAMGLLAMGWLGAVSRDAPWRLMACASAPVFLLVLYLTSSRGSVVALLVGTALIFAFDPRRKRFLVVCGAGLLGGLILVLAASQMSDLTRARTGGNAQVEGLILLVLTIAVVAATYALLRRFEDRLFAKPVPRLPRAAWIVVGVLALVALVLINPIRQIDSFVAEPRFDPAELQRSAELTATENLATAHLLSSTGNGRWQYWSAAGSAFWDRPIAGIGAGGYTDYYTTHRNTLLFGRHPHSLPLGFLAELGLIGFLLATGFLVVVLGTAWRRWRAGPADSPTSEIPILSAIALTGLAGMSIDWTSEFPVVAAPVLIAFAALVGPATRRPGTEPDRELGARLPRALRPSLTVPLVTILVAGAAIVFSAWGYGISSNLADSREALAGKDLEEAKEKAQNAVDLAPWSSDARMQLASAQELSGEYVPALREIEQAAESAPLDSRPLLAEFRVLIALGDPYAATRALLKARRLDPHAPAFEFAKMQE